MSKLYNILDKITPKDSLHFCEQKKLVWTNPNPSASFGAQTITAQGVTSSDDIEIVYKDSDGPTYAQRFRSQGKLTCFGGSTYPTEAWGKKFTVSADSIEFFATYYHSIGSSGTGTNNSKIIPREIYVIKKLGE